jgi:hypothetical protein
VRTVQTVQGHQLRAAKGLPALSRRDRGATNINNERTA